MHICLYSITQFVVFFNKMIKINFFSLIQLKQLITRSRYRDKLVILAQFSIHELVFSGGLLLIIIIQSLYRLNLFSNYKYIHI